jgi:hypothetical protein
MCSAWSAGWTPNTPITHRLHPRPARACGRRRSVWDRYTVAGAHFRRAGGRVPRGRVQDESPIYEGHDGDAAGGDSAGRRGAGGVQPAVTRSGPNPCWRPSAQALPYAPAHAPRAPSQVAAAPSRPGTWAARPGPDLGSGEHRLAPGASWERSARWLPGHARRAGARPDQQALLRGARRPGHAQDHGRRGRSRRPPRPGEQPADRHRPGASRVR